MAVTISLKTPLINAGYTGKLLVNLVGWVGAPGQQHKDTRYNYNDPLHLSAILDNLQLFGADGVIYTWQGPGANFTHIGAMQTCDECHRRGLLFGLMADPWICKNATDKEAAWIAAINHPETEEMLNSSVYLPEKAILDFSTGADFTKISAAVPQYQYWLKHTHYSWLEFPDPLSILNSENAGPNMKMCGLFWGFFDGGMVRPDGTRDWNTSVWGGGPARWAPSESGSLYLDTVARIQRSVPYVQLITGTDSDEGTDLMKFMVMTTGIRIGN